jgi:hypothetical protein
MRNTGWFKKSMLSRLTGGASSLFVVARRAATGDEEDERRLAAQGSSSVRPAAPRKGDEELRKDEVGTGGGTEVVGMSYMALKTGDASWQK